jgi:hypothetical protein
MTDETKEPAWVALLMPSNIRQDSIVSCSLDDDGTRRFSIFKLIMSGIVLSAVGRLHMRFRVAGDKSHHRGPVYNQGADTKQMSVGSPEAVMGRKLTALMSPLLDPNKPAQMEITLDAEKGRGEWNLVLPDHGLVPHTFTFNSRTPLDSLRFAAYATDGTPLRITADTHELYGLQGYK